MSTATRGLKPYALWDIFSSIARIPHPSRGESALATHILDVVRSHGLEAIQDDAGNVIVRKEAGPGRKGAPGVVLQAHLDMVCEKNGDSDHDFEKDPIRLHRDGDYITAVDTTLGADNGLGVAAALAVLLDRKLVHGPLECVFTVDEEDGFTGVYALQPGVLRGRYLLNLDSEHEGLFCVGSAGGADTAFALPTAREAAPKGHTPVGLVVGGLHGGHSGIDIHLGRANAVKLLARTILRAIREQNVRLAAVSCGAKANAIPREAQAVLYVKDRQLERFRKCVVEMQDVLRGEYGPVDPGLELGILPAEPVQGGTVFKKRAQQALLRLLYALPHGVQSRTPGKEELVETSMNVASVVTEPAEVRLVTSQRSSSKSALENLLTTLDLIGEMAGATVVHANPYLGWTPNFASPLLGIAFDCYREMFDREPGVETMHAGLECGVVSMKYPAMDMLSFGPTIQSVHTPRERVEIASVLRFWDFLVGLLEKLSRCD